MKDLHCPNCGTPFVRVKYQPGTVERVLNRFKVFPFRCQLCTTQFRAFWPSSSDASREFDRREFKRLPASFQAKVLTEQTAKSEHHLTDISMGGCTLETVSALPKGAFLELLIKPASDEDAIKVETAMVCSVRPASVGVQFLEFKGDDQQRLSQVVLSLWVGQSVRPSPYS
ncbi:MAG: PilZ domain-containing protein [Nitrospira sp.]